MIPLLIGLALALPLGWLTRRYPRVYTPMVGVSGLLYTIPSLALFVALPGIIGTKILDPVNVVVALTLYTVALLVRTVADGLGAVPEDVKAAATAMGYRRIRRLLSVELPIAIPVIAAGPARRRRVQRQPGQRRRADRRTPARPAVHQRLPALLLHPDRAAASCCACCWHSCSTGSSCWPPGC